MASDPELPDHLGPMVSPSKARRVVDNSPIVECSTDLRRIGQTFHGPFWVVSVVMDLENLGVQSPFKQESVFGQESVFRQECSSDKNFGTVVRKTQPTLALLFVLLLLLFLLVLIQFVLLCAAVVAAFAS